MLNRRILLGPALLFGLSLSGVASAQEVPKGATADKKVSEGSTSLTDDTAATAATDDGGTDATELGFAAGGMLSTGNSRQLAGTANGKFRYRKDSDQFKAAVAANYGRSGAPDTKVETTVENYQGIARYERFLGDFTVFLSTQAYRDRFRGLDLRGRVDPGVGYYFINKKTTQLWTELGYDLLVDFRRSDSLQVLNADGTPTVDAAGNPVLLDDTEVVHSARLFVGFEYSFHDSLQLSLGSEYLQGISDTAVYRINSTAGINAKIDSNLALAVGFTERYDSAPLPGKENLDTITTVSVVYTLL